MFDAARLFASVAIIWLHTIESDVLRAAGEIGRFAVPFFTAAAIFFLWNGLSRSSNRSFGEYAQARFRRIYVPFLAWTAIYLLLSNAKRMFISHAPYIAPSLSMLWVGTAYHLWFLPFVLCACLLTFPVLRAAMLGDAHRTSVTIACVVLGFVFALVPPPDSWYALGPTTALVISSWRAAPSVFWGTGFTILFHTTTAGRWMRSVPVTVAAVVATAFCVAVPICAGRNNFLLENLAGLGWLLVAVSPIERPWLAIVSKVGKSSYGIYLVHGAFIEGAQAFIARMGVAKSAWVDASVFACAVVGSLSFPSLMVTSRWTRWLVS